MRTRILIINPNSTATMTADICATAKTHALADTDITAINPTDGPPSIQGPEDAEACLPGLFATFEEAMQSAVFDAVIIACFDDTGLEELKQRVSIPVLGIGEAAFHAAAMLGTKFSTVTTLSVSVPVIEKNIERYGFADQSIRVRASEVPVLHIGDDTYQNIRSEAERAILEDSSAAIVLGCAGMADLAEMLSRDLGCPVIDGVTAAVGFCETLTRVRTA